MNWYLGVLRNYVGFSGRAHRTEFWMFVLINLIIAFILGLIDAQLGLLGPTGYGVISGIYSLVVLVPTIAVTVRRLHDTGRSGWWILLWLIPVVGFIILLVLLIGKGTEGDNEYGADPLA